MVTASQIDARHRARRDRARFGLRLQVCRTNQQVNLSDLATQTGITAVRLSKLERGLAVARDSELAALQRALPRLNAAPPIPAPAPPHRVPAAASAATPRLTISRATPLGDLPELLHVREAASWLDCSTGAVYGLLRQQRLASVRLGRLLRVPRSALAAFVATDPTDLRERAS